MTLEYGNNTKDQTWKIKKSRGSDPGKNAERKNQSRGGRATSSQKEKKHQNNYE